MTRAAWLLILTAVALGADLQPRDTYLDAYSDSRDSGLPPTPLPAGVVFPTSMYEKIAMGSASFDSPGTHSYSTLPPSKSYGASQPSYGAPSPAYGAPQPSYGAPSPAYGAPQPSYGPPSPAYGAPQPSYGAPSPAYGAPHQNYYYGGSYPYPHYEDIHHPHEKPLKDNHAVAENTPDRGLHSISIHLVLKILLKAVIFKLIVKFIAVICILLFMPSFDFKEDTAAKDEERGTSLSNSQYESNEKLDSLTTLVLQGIGKDFKEDGCKATSNCRLARIAQSVDNHYTFKRLLHIFYENATGLVVIKTPPAEFKTDK